MSKLDEILAPVKVLKDEVLALEQEREEVAAQIKAFWKDYWVLDAAKKNNKAKLDAARNALATECSKHKDLMELLKSMK